MNLINLLIKYQNRLLNKSSGVLFVKLLKHLTWSIVTVVLGIALANRTTEPVAPLRIGANLWTGYGTLYLARDLGYYDKKPVKLVDYPSGTEEVRAYRNNEIEGAGLSIDQAISLAAIQENIKIIAIMEVSHGGDVFLGKPEITDMKALKGKRVGVEATSLGALFITHALEKHGISVKDIQIFPLELTEYEQAYKQGTLDAVFTFGLVKIKLLVAGSRSLFDSKQIPGEIVDILAVSTEALTNYSDTIKALINPRFCAFNHSKKSPGYADIRITKRTQLTPKRIWETFKLLRQNNLQENQKILNETNLKIVNNMKNFIQKTWELCWKFD
ncbi:ABC transporter substrate-binding protein [Trichormus azollae]|jgi:NitT/TauT family transport system substrate-binding protein|uniref:ABC-type nitrate/sulfonate/bicarbonate transport system protein n=1 Tax=Nostoc azollae (strain 0708) TaxID=551115 RepID=D7E3G5_NOSA0|nr:ABC transporter substrate-binding protein [Trichormus azollae]ADI65134.1 ABC-type nitrate/sulfonate/bicarbonate transport system protein ['Nostoc azollae' 0708]